MNDLEKKFNDHTNKWKKDTRFHSNVGIICEHPDYLEIIKMGEDVVPFMLKDFSNGKYRHWFYALYVITGVNPIKPEIAGCMKEMANAWLTWAEENGYSKF